MKWGNPPKLDPLFLNSSDYDWMVQSWAAFTGQFKKDGPFLDMVDAHILKRVGPAKLPLGLGCTPQGLVDGSVLSVG